MLSEPQTNPPDYASAQIDQLGQLLDHVQALEAQFHSLREQLTHCHRLSTLGTLTSMIAHEYNNILTPIISYAQLALAAPEDRALLLKAVEKALAGAERAAAISTSMLGFARETDPKTPALSHLPTVARESVQCLGRDPRKDGIELTIDLPDVAAAIAPLQLQQVFVNLILNAREAMKRGGRLSMTGQVANGWVTVAVRDSGPGIPSDMLDRIFEPFVTTKLGDECGSKKGTGLGLCICRDLVRQAGGDLTATSRHGAEDSGGADETGATFHITLPLAKV